MPIADEQFGSTPGRGTTGAILAGGGQLMEKHRGKQKGIVRPGKGAR